MSETVKQRTRRKVNKVRDEIKKCTEPEIIFEDFILKNVLNKSFLASILYDIGVEVDEILMGRAEKLQVIKRKVEFELTSKRHVSEGPDHFIANKCAIKVAEEGNLSLDRRGDIEMFCKMMGCCWGYAKKIT